VIALVLEAGRMETINEEVVSAYRKEFNLDDVAHLCKRQVAGAQGLPAVLQRVKGRRMRDSQVADHRATLKAHDERADIAHGHDLYLSLRALSAYGGLSVRRLRTALLDTTWPLPHYRVGRKILVRRTDFDAWVFRFRRDG
jgi:lambda repressor-like predicted transcriptional regulator